MSEHKHTPGPWHVGMRPGPIVYGAKGEQVADCRGLFNERGHDARRIVACVNACEGIDTDKLDREGLTALVGPALRGVVLQRDELLAALERAERAMSNVAAVGIPEALEIVRAAIAKAKP